MILFFSGGTALSATARALARAGTPTAHLITPFDSGGSSGPLRTIFNMPAVGDLRARIMDLAPDKLPGMPAARAFFAHRLSVQASEADLRAELHTLCDGSHPLLANLEAPERLTAIKYICLAAKNLPQEASLKGACLGNLVMAGAYTYRKKGLAAVVEDLSTLLQVRDTVRPTVDANAHLAVRLADGRVLVGQHTFTGKNGGPVTSPIEAIWFTASLNSDKPVALGLDPGAAELIAQADLICYPMGSFYSSVLANLMPEGTGRALLANPCPKVFVPNLGEDPELLGLTLKDQVQRLLHVLLHDTPKAAARDILSIVLVDPSGSYPGGIPREWLAEQGIRLDETPLVSPASSPLVDGTLLGKALRRLRKEGLALAPGMDAGQNVSP